MLIPELIELPEIGEIPKYGCCTIREILAIQQCLPPELFGAGDVVRAIAFSSHIQSVLTSILLTSRLKYWSLAECFLLSPATREQASQFLLNERNRWGDLPSVPKGGKPLSWDAVRYRLSRGFPGMSCWQSEAEFLAMPLSKVETAIEQLNELELQQAEMMGMPIAILSCTMAAAHGVKRPRVEDYNPAMRERRRIEARRTVDPEAAALFMRLLERQEVQPWAVSLLDVETIKLAAE